MLAELEKAWRASSAGRWYFGREPSERRIIAAVAAALAVLILWGGVWKPVSDWRAVEHNRYQNAQALIDWMRANEARARSVARAQQTGGNERSLLPVITRSARSAGLTLNRIQPESNGAVSVVLQAQPFNSLLRWLDDLQQRSGATVVRISVDSEGRPGIVNAQVRLM